jgi:uncharacterized protein YlxW (UPF0749 family)
MKPRPIRRSSTRSLLAWTLAFTGASLLVLLAWAAVGRSSAGDSVRRAEIEAREVHLYQRLANGEAILESQRQIYIERLRRLEALIFQKDEEINSLRSGAGAASMTSEDQAPEHKRRLP